MTVLDRPTHAVDYAELDDRRISPANDELHCVVCHQAFDFAAGQTAVVLRHIAYGYDFAHQGQCLATARSWIFVDPEYDRPAFSSDGQRERILRVSSAVGWSAVLPNAHELIEAGQPVTYQPLRLWALVEYRDGHQCMEGIIRDDEWRDEPGGAEFVEALTGHQASLGYVNVETGRRRPPGQPARSKTTPASMLD
jgi:hypothetical protein